MPGRSIGWDLHTPDDPAAAPSHWQRYGFDGAGRLNAVSSPAGEYSYTYVEQSHLLASVTGPVHTVTNSYESGRDAMTSKTNAAASGTVSRFGAKYDALGRRIETSRSGSAFAQNFVSGYQYDLLGQLTSDARFEGATPGAPDQKLEEESFAFLYDGIGNRLTAHKGNDTTAYTPNALNQYTDIDGIEPVYDADGNLFSDGKNRFHWDAENRLTLVEPLVPTEGTKRLGFKYDYIGRRVSKQVWTRTGGSWTDESTTAFVYDGWNLIEEVSTSSQTASINHYTWGLDLSLSLQGAGGVGGLLSVVCAPFTESGLIGDWLLPIGYVSLAPSTFHYTYDLNGNVSEVLDATGSIAAHYEYGPFGELTHEFHSSNSHLLLLTFNFSTKYYDTELKTYYYGYRYYDPSTGRWLNRDPIEESGGLNLYGFVGNDAVNRWDLWGKVPNGTGDYRDTDTETFIIDWEDKEHGFLIRSISLRMNAVDDPEWNMAIDKFVYSAGGTIDGVFENIIHPNLPVQLLLFSKILNELFNGVNTALGNSIGWHVHLTLDVSEKSKLFGYNLPFYSNKTTPYPFAKIENPKHFLGLWLVCSIDELRNNPDFEYEFSIVLANLINQLE